jgi:hypothetical protein
VGRRFNKSVHNAAPTVDKKARALELRANYKTLREIGAELGVSHQTAARWIDEEMKRIITPPAEHLVKLELQRYDQWTKVLLERLDSGGDPEKIIPLLFKASKSRRELLGLDAAIKVDATVTETTQEDLALQEMLREARAKQAILDSQAATTVGPKIDAGKE